MTASGEAGFEADGECIFAICCYRVGFKFHKDIDSASPCATKSREKVRRRKLLKWVLRVRATEKATLHICRGLPPRKVGDLYSPSV